MRDPQSVSMSLVSASSSDVKVAADEPASGATVHHRRSSSTRRRGAAATDGGDAAAHAAAQPRADPTADQVAEDTLEERENSSSAAPGLRDDDSKSRSDSLRWRVIWSCFPVSLLCELFVKYQCWQNRYETRLIDVPALNLRLDWTYSENARSALGFLGFLSPEARRILYGIMGVITIGATIWVAFSSARVPRPWRLGVALIALGGFGNLVDRALIHCVVDYLYIRAFRREWSVCFNASDLAIDAGLGILLYQVWATSGDDDGGDSTADVTHETRAA